MIVCARQGKEFRSLYLPSRAIEIFWILDSYIIARHKGNKAFIFFKTLWYAEQFLGGFFVVVLFVFLFSVCLFGFFCGLLGFCFGLFYPKEKGVCPASFHLYVCLFAFKFVELMIPPNFISGLQDMLICHNWYHIILIWHTVCSYRNSSQYWWFLIASYFQKTYCYIVSLTYI